MVSGCNFWNAVQVFRMHALARDQAMVVVLWQVFHLESEVILRLDARLSSRSHGVEDRHCHRVLPRCDGLPTEGRSVLQLLRRSDFLALGHPRIAAGAAGAAVAVAGVVPAVAATPAATAPAGAAAIRGAALSPDSIAATIAATATTVARVAAGASARVAVGAGCHARLAAHTAAAAAAKAATTASVSAAAM